VRRWPPDLVAGIEDLPDPSGILVDARAPERYRGEVEPVDPRAGHIPGAVNLPCTGNLDADGRWRSPAELRERFVAVGAASDPTSPGGRVISYCGSGVTACHNLIGLELAGLAAGRLYPGSWSQYCADPERPAETG
jgi:thiosulfate/3-mercaptopyruvate sulfurtransferase